MIISTSNNNITSGKGVIHIDHAASQTRNKSLRVPAEDIHDKSPAQTCKYRPCVVGNLGTSVGADKVGERVHARLDRELGKSKYHTRKDVDDNLVTVNSSSCPTLYRSSRIYP